MKQTLCALLALFLLFGFFGCGNREQTKTKVEQITTVTGQPTTAPEIQVTTEPQTNLPSPSETDPLVQGSPASEPAPEPEPEPAESLPVYSLSAEYPTQWTKRLDTETYPYNCDETITVYKTGEMTMTHGGVLYRLAESGENYRVEKDLYASPFDEQPTVTLDAGEIRLTGTDSVLHVEPISDPLGIFVGFSSEDLTLSFDHYRTPGAFRAYQPCYFGAGPQFQPGTFWSEWAPHKTISGSGVYYSNCRLNAEVDGTVHGTFQKTYESENEDCVLLWAGDAAALTRPDGELLLFGGLQESRYDRDDCGEYAIRADYDPHALSVGNTLILYKGFGDAEPKTVLGMGKYQIIADFTEAGWTYEPLSMKRGEWNDYGELFVKLKKDGRMLLVYLSESIVGRYGDEWYAAAYVLIGADGKLESWGGMKPGDHTLADGYKLSDPFPFIGGLWGIAEDDNVFLLDDGRILVTYDHHESGEVLEFITFDPRG